MFFCPKCFHEHFARCFGVLGAFFQLPGARFCCPAQWRRKLSPSRSQLSINKLNLRNNTQRTSIVNRLCLIVDPYDEKWKNSSIIKVNVGKKKSNMCIRVVTYMRSNRKLKLWQLGFLWTCKELVFSWWDEKNVGGWKNVLKV